MSFDHRSMHGIRSPHIVSCHIASYHISIEPACCNRGHLGIGSVIPISASCHVGACLLTSRTVSLRCVASHSSWSKGVRCFRHRVSFHTSRCRVALPIASLTSSSVRSSINASPDSTMAFDQTQPCYLLRSHCENCVLVVY